MILAISFDSLWPFLSELWQVGGFDVFLDCCQRCSGVCTAGTQLVDGWPQTKCSSGD